MRTFIAGFIVGVVVATVGFGGVSRMLDRGIDTVKNTSQELAK